MTPLLAFYLGSHPDHRGRMLAEIVAQDDNWLELTHDYIQWLFPLNEHSRVVPSAPILLPEDIRTFREDDLLKSHMLVAFNRMLRFFGLIQLGGEIKKSSNWDQRKTNWFTEPTHNNLRITRILKSLSILGLEEEAQRFYVVLEQLCSTERECGVPDESRSFWQQATSAVSHSHTTQHFAQGDTPRRTR